MCDCLTRINKQIEPFNECVETATSMRFSDGFNALTIRLWANSCPFCGEKWVLDYKIHMYHRMKKANRWNIKKSTIIGDATTRS